MAGAVKFAVVGLFVLGAAVAPAFAQQSTDELKRELDTLKEKVQALEKDQAARKAAPAPKSDENLMKLEDDKTVLDLLMEDAKISGFVDVGFVYNIDRPQNGKNGAITGTADGSIRAFDRDSRSFYLHNAQLNIARAPTDKLIIGYNVEISIGADADVIAAGTDLDSTGAASTDYFDIQEANIQILAPVGRGLTFTLGKFATFAGYEVIESKDNYNYSRSLPFLFAIPFTHTGIRATYSFSDQITASLGANNGWDNALDNNDAKTLEFNLTVLPIPWLKFLANFYYGAEKAASAVGHNVGDKRMLLDFVAVASDIPGLKGWTFGLNFDLGEEEDSTVTGTGVEDAEWSGFAAYVKYQINEQWAGAFRYSMIDDDDLFRTGAIALPAGTTSNTISEVTVTLEYAPVKGLKLRLEYRMDMSDEDIFSADTTGGSLEDSQSTIGMEAILEF
jgi:hypothetical protein